MADWECAGNDPPFSNASWWKPSVAQVRVTRTAWLNVQFAVPAAVVGPLVLKNSSYASLSWLDMLAARDLPARQRDGAWQQFSVGIVGGQILALTGASTTFQLSASGWMTRRHVVAVASMPATMQIDGHLTRNSSP